MVGSTLVTIGLVLDIVGVALLLAGPRVHPRHANPLFLGDEVEGDTRLRRMWSRFGRLGLPTVSAGFTLQILGAWANELPWSVLGPLIGFVVPAVFVLFYLLVRLLPVDSVDN